MAKKEKYYHLSSGEWFQPLMRGHRLQCCSCSLIHVIDFRMRKDGSIEMRMREDKVATGVSRRKLKPILRKHLKSP